jgi:hypothetical protein
MSLDREWEWPSTGSVDTRPTGGRASVNISNQTDNEAVAVRGLTPDHNRVILFRCGLFLFPSFRKLDGAAIRADVCIPGIVARFEVGFWPTYFSPCCLLGLRKLSKGSLVRWFSGCRIGDNRPGSGISGEAQVLDMKQFGGCSSVG